MRWTAVPPGVNRCPSPGARAAAGGSCKDRARRHRDEAQAAYSVLSRAAGRLDEFGRWSGRPLPGQVATAGLVGAHGEVAEGINRLVAAGAAVLAAAKITFFLSPHIRASRRDR